MKTAIPKSLAILTFLFFFNARPMVQAVVPPPDGFYPGGNTAEGQNALLNLTNGAYNTAVGFLSLRGNMTGNFNTGIGAGTLFANTGDSNTATGVGALLSNTANENTANGTLALFSNTTGLQNTAVGFSALASNTTAGANSSGANTAVGAFALGSNVTGGANTAIGYAALYSSTVGGNIALGDLAGVDITTGSGNIIIGHRGLPADTNTIRIGKQTQTKCFIAGIRNVTTDVGDAIPVVIDSASQLGTVSSSKRFKKEIKPMKEASEAILGLEPVTFRYKNDTAERPQFGLIAEQVADVNPDLVVRNSNGEIYTVRYEAVNAMLLNEFLKEHKKVEQLETTVTNLAEQLRKVSARVETNNSVPQVAVVDR
jgi:hypothetical protein